MNNSKLQHRKKSLSGLTLPMITKTTPNNNNIITPAPPPVLITITLINYLHQLIIVFTINS